MPKAEVIPEPAAPPAIPREPRRSLRLILTRWLYERACMRAGTLPCHCAYGDCRYPGYRASEFEVYEDDGTCRYFFCGRRHKSLWLAESGFSAT